MCLLLESIKCINGRLQDLDYHQNRVNRALEAFYPERDPLILKKEISIPAALSGVFKCRFTYGNLNYSFEFIPYTAKRIKSLRLIEVEAYHYPHKFLDRTSINTFFQKRNDSDDIIMTKEGMITDTSYANLAFYDGENWYTPDTPLLPGIKRQKLIDLEILKPIKISREDLSCYQKVSLINAMLELEDITVLIKDIRT
jgi:4-amino-4-deoxychorismate lyase